MESDSNTAPRVMMGQQQETIPGVRYNILVTECVSTFQVRISTQEHSAFLQSKGHN